MPTINDLLARRARTWEEYQETLSKGGDDGFDEETRTKLDRMDSDIRSTTEDIERLQSAAELDERFSAVDRGAAPGIEGSGGGATEPSAADRYAEAFRSFMRGGNDGVTPEQRQLLQGGFVSGGELRAQGVTTGAAGGFLVPEGFRNKLVETLKFFGAVRSVAGNINTETGNPLPWPTNDDTGNEGAYLAENTQMAEQDITFGSKALEAHVLGSKVVRVSLQLIQDSAFDIDNWLPRKLGERIARRENRAFTVGTGTGEPEGVTVGATVGVTGAAGSTLTLGPTQAAALDNLISLEHSIDVAYRNERARYMFHDSTLAYLRKFKDADGRPLWQPALVAGTPSLLNGQPYTVNNNMPTMAADAISVVYGDFETGYIIRDVQDITVLRLVERYADYLQVGFLAFARHDGMVDDASALRAYKNSAA